MAKLYEIMNEIGNLDTLRNRTKKTGEILNFDALDRLQAAPEKLRSRIFACG